MRSCRPSENELQVGISSMDNSISKFAVPDKLSGHGKRAKSVINSKCANTVYQARENTPRTH